jgi:small subunit ribosomal protein S1
MEIGSDGLRRRNGSDTGDVPTPADDGYWEALLDQGEVVSSDAPPPWIDTDRRNDYFPTRPNGHEGWNEEGEWQRAVDLLDREASCHLPVCGHNRGGLLVEFGCLVGFVPSSHLVGFPAYSDPLEREAALVSRLGQQLKLQVIEIDRLRNRLILSERIACEEERSHDLFARLRVGEVISGRISNLRRFGAFVDLGGYEGLIHISELSWGRVNYPGDIVQPGDVVQVLVLDVNPDERKIQLSLKQLQTDPWRDVGQHYQVGQIVQGVITNVVSFGAFVRLEEGIEGLIHISELAEGTFLHPRNVVREGQRIEAKVLGIDADNRRIALSLRQMRAMRQESPTVHHHTSGTGEITLV